MDINSLIAQSNESASQVEKRAKTFSRLDALVAVIDECFLTRQNWPAKDRAVMRILSLTRQVARQGGKAKFRLRLAYYACRAFSALRPNEMRGNLSAFQAELKRCLGDVPVLPNWMVNTITRIHERAASAHGYEGVRKIVANSATGDTTPTKAKQGKGIRKRPKADKKKSASAPINPAMADALKAAGMDKHMNGAAVTH